MRRLLVLLLAVGALLVAAGVSSADGPLPPPPPPPDTDTFFNPPGGLLLQVNVEPWGSGYVRSVSPSDVLLLAPYYIDCPLACIRPIDRGSSFLLFATPTPGFTFAGWEVANHGQPQLPSVCPGTAPICTLSNVTQSMDVVATFSGRFVGEPSSPGGFTECKGEC